MNELILVVLVIAWALLFPRLAAADIMRKAEAIRRSLISEEPRIVDTETQTAKALWLMVEAQARTQCEILERQRESSFLDIHAGLRFTDRTARLISTEQATPVNQLLGGQYGYYQQECYGTQNLSGGSQGQSQQAERLYSENGSIVCDNDVRGSSCD